MSDNAEFPKLPTGTKVIFAVVRSGRWLQCERELTGEVVCATAPHADRQEHRITMSDGSVIVLATK